MKKKAAAICALGLTSAAPAFGDPDFGPGNSSKGPNDGGAKCRAPGHGTGPGANDPVPGCKGTQPSRASADMGKERTRRGPRRPPSSCPGACRGEVLGTTSEADDHTKQGERLWW